MARKWSDLFLFLVTGARVGAQAAFLLLLPKFLLPADAASALLAISVSATVCPVAALGSQFRIIQLSAEGHKQTKSAMSTYLSGFSVLLLFGLLVPTFYAHSHVSLPVLFSVPFLAINYLRVFPDCLAQGLARIQVLQAAYLAFWVSKLAAVVSWYWWRGHASLGFLVALEFAVSMPWMALTVRSCVSTRARPTLRLGWATDIGGSLATATRGIWQEVDRLLLPLVVPQGIYVEYSIATRVATGAQAFTLAQLGQLTPRIVRGGGRNVGAIVRGGKRGVLFSALAYSGGALITLATYPHMVPQVVSVLVVGILVTPVMFWASVYMDVVFYHVSLVARSLLNVLGLSLAATFVLLASATSQLVVVTIGLLVSYACAGFVARSIVRRRETASR